MHQRLNNRLDEGHCWKFVLNLEDLNFPVHFYFFFLLIGVLLHSLQVKLLLSVFCKQLLELAHISFAALRVRNLSQIVGNVVLSSGVL